MPTTPASASFVTIGDLLAKQARIRGTSIAVRHDGESLTYRELDQNVTRLANYLRSKGVVPGDRIAILSPNSRFYLELALAAARAGCILATLNWRLSQPEIEYCIGLVSPELVFVDGKYADRIIDAAVPVVPIDSRLSSEISAQSLKADFPSPGPEDGHVIIYTSGTTGFPKAAVISHRAMIARVQVQCIDYGINHEDTFLCWSPMFHTAAMELAVGSLLIGGNVVVRDGLDFEQMCTLLETESISNLIFFPGMADEVIEKLERRRPKVKRLKKFGALADLFVPAKIARLTELLGTPYTNTFGMTECGMPPASAGKIPIGVEPHGIPKLESCFCDVQVVDEAGGELPFGEPGELVVRGPILFSGYWADDAATAEAFRGGWYHTGDMFSRNEDGTLNYLGRRKYLIKSGGENIYPAEIERIILMDGSLADAIVVARKDETWGEVPVAVVAPLHGQVDVDALYARCAAALARYKRPKDVYVVDSAFFPRNNTGKIIRKQVEDWIHTQGVGQGARSE